MEKGGGKGRLGRRNLFYLKREGGRGREKGKGEGEGRKKGEGEGSYWSEGSSARPRPCGRSLESPRTLGCAALLQPHPFAGDCVCVWRRR